MVQNRNKDFTTIAVQPETKTQLEELKVHRRQGYDELILDLIKLKQAVNITQEPDKKQHRPKVKDILKGKNVGSEISTPNPYITATRDKIIA